MKLIKTKLKLFSKWGILLFALLSSCEKLPLEAEKTLNQEKFSRNETNNLLASFSPIYHSLGHGYDVTGEYANSNSARQQVIDVVGLNAANASFILTDNDTHQDGYFSAGENSVEYAKSLTAKVTTKTDIPFFSTSVRSNFTDSLTKKDTYSFATGYLIIRQKRIQITALNSQIINHLTLNFKNDLKLMTPAQLVKKYGTHVLVDIGLGGRLELNYSTQSNSRQTYNATAAGLDVAAMGIFSVNLDINSSVSQKSSNFNQILRYKSIGGDGTKGIFGEIQLDGKAPTKINIAGWQSTCTKENAALIEIPQGGLVPLQDLISDATKKSQIATFINQYLTVNQIKITNFENVKYGRYRLTNLNSNKVLAIPQALKTSGTQAIQWSWMDGPEQKWDIEKLIDNKYKIINANSGLVLAVSEGSSTNGTKVIQWPWQNGEEQKWFFEKLSDGSYKIKNSKSGLVLAVASNSIYDNAKIIQWPWQNGKEQKWKLNLLY